MFEKVTSPIAPVLGSICGGSKSGVVYHETTTSVLVTASGITAAL